MGKSRFQQVAATLATAMLLAILAHGSAGAAPLSQTKKTGYFGEVTGVENGSLTVTLKNGEVVSLAFDESTKVRRVRVESDEEPGLFDERHVGSRVAILAETRDNGPFAAKVTVIPSATRDRHLTLTVIDREGDVIVAETKSGEEVLVELDFEPSEELKGQLVTFIGEQLEAGRFRAKSVVGVRKIVDRLERHVRSKTKQVDEERDASKNKAQQRRLGQLKRRLQEAVTEHLDRFSEVLLKSPDQAKAALEEAQERLNKTFRAALGALGKRSEEIDRTLVRRALHGRVDAISVEDGVVTIVTAGDHVASIAVVDTTQIHVGKEVGSLGDIIQGDAVEVVFDRESGEARAIRVKLAAQVKGHLDSVDSESGTVVIALRGGATLTLSVEDASQVRVNGELVALSSLEPGTLVGVEYSRRDLKVLAVRAESEAEHSLTVTHVDREERTITGQTRDGRTVTLKLARDGRVDTGGARASLNALKAGARVRALIKRGSDEALAIRGDEEVRKDRERAVRGIVRSLDVEARALSIERADGSRIDVILADNAEVLVNGEPAQIDGIHADSALLVQYDPETGLALRVVVRERAETGRAVNARVVRRSDLAQERAEETGEITFAGILIRTDAESGTIALLAANRRIVKLTVTGDSVLALNGEPISDVGALPRGAELKVRADAGTRQVLELGAHKREVDRAAVRKKLDPAKLQQRLREAKTELTIRVRGVPVAGTEMALIVLLRREPVAGAEITINDRVVGLTDERGVIAGKVPENADVLNIIATLNEQRAGLRLKILTKEQLDQRKARLRDAAEGRRSGQNSEEGRRTGSQRTTGGSR